MSGRVSNLAAAAVGILLATAPPARAASPVHAGVEAGYMLSRLQSDWGGVVTDVAGLRSAAAGVYLQFPSGLLGWQLEALYLDKGVSITVPAGSGGHGTANWSRPSLEVPLLLRLDADLPGLGVHPYAFAGPFAAFALSQSLSVKDGSIGTLRADQLRTSDYGVQVGAGVAMPFGPGQLTLNGRFDVGLADVADADVYTHAVRTRTVLVMAGFAF